MTDDSTIAKLAGIDLFRGIGADDVKTLLANSTELSFSQDQSIFESGFEERALYFLIDGTVEIGLSVPFVENKILDELNPVSVFGESTFFHARPHSVTALALTEVTLVRLERQAYDQLLESNCIAACRLGANAAEILAAKLQHTDEWIAELLQNQESHRVQQKWWDFRESLGHAFEHPPGGGFSTSAGWR